MAAAWTKEPKERFYARGKADGVLNLVLPVQFADLQKASETGILDCYANAVGKGEYQTVYLKLHKRHWKELASNYPKTCGNCKFKKIQFLSISNSALGYRASFTCPKCGKITFNDFLAGGG